MSATQQNAKSALVPKLEPVLNTRYALSWKQAALVVPFVCFYLYLTHSPLAPVVWSSVAAGRQILETGSIPAELSVMPLASGVGYFRLAWLSDVMFAAAYNIGGAGGISALGTILLTITALLWARLFGWYTLRKRMLVAAVAVVFAVWWRYSDEPGSMFFGSLCLALFASLLFDPRTGLDVAYPVSVLHWALLAGLMVLWVNLSPSFLVGLIVLAAIGFEVLLQRCSIDRKSGRSIYACFGDHSVQRAFWMLQVAILATLLNPLGTGLWSNLFRLNANPFVAYFGRAPIQLASFSGLLLALVLLSVLYAAWQNHFASIKTLIVVAVGTIAVAFNEHMLVWFAPIAMLMAVRTRTNEYPVAGEFEEEVVAAPGEHKPLQFAWSLIALLAIWCGFALSPLSDPLLSTKQRPMHSWLSTSTPHRVTKFLGEHPAEGLIFAPARWGDWIAFEGQPGTTVFTTSEFELLPRYAKRDYLKILRGEHEWERAADRYAVRTLVIDKKNQPTLARSARLSGDWRLQFEDRMAMVLTRGGIQ